MRTRGNSGIIGKVATPSAAGASGIHSLSDHGIYVLNNIYPGVKGIAAVASGGTVTLSRAVGVYHTFTASGSFVPTASLQNCTVLVVGGGEGGGTNNFPGPAGAGGYVTYYTGINFTASSYTITVGDGGAANAAGYNYGATGGTSSIVGSGVNVSAQGGFGFGVFQTQSGYNNNGATGTYTGGNGAGGAGAGANGGAVNGGIGSSLGSDLTTAIAAAGGTVYGHLVSGTYYYGGGGGAYSSTTYVGGGGGIGNNGSPTVGTANTGGGGGGGGTTNAAAGGRGIVIIFYPY